MGFRRNVNSLACVFTVISCFAMGRVAFFALPEAEATTFNVPPSHVLSDGGNKEVEQGEVLRPLQPIVPSDQEEAARWLGRAAATVLFMIIGAVVLWHLRKRDSLREIKTELHPDEQAHEQIEELVALGLCETGREKEFYSALSIILRGYMETLRGLPASKLTTEEIARHLEDGDDLTVVDVLRHADYVKFADAVASPNAMKWDAAAVLSHIRRTGAFPAKSLTENATAEV